MRFGPCVASPLERNRTRPRESWIRRLTWTTHRPHSERPTRRGATTAIARSTFRDFKFAQLSRLLAGWSRRAKFKILHSRLNTRLSFLRSYCTAKNCCLLLYFVGGSWCCHVSGRAPLQHADDCWSDAQTLGCDATSHRREQKRTDSLDPARESRLGGGRGGVTAAAERGGSSVARGTTRSEQLLQFARCTLARLISYLPREEELYYYYIFTRRYRANPLILIPRIQVRYLLSAGLRFDCCLTFFFNSVDEK